MNSERRVYIGTDSGATTSKIGGVWADGSTVSLKLLQRPTNFSAGPETVAGNWVGGVVDFLKRHNLGWEDVQGVGLAIPGPFQRYGVLDVCANLPSSYVGWDAHGAYAAALAKAAGRALPLIMGNDGNFGGVAEAKMARGGEEGTVLLLAPGSGLGCAFIDRNGLPLDGDTLAGMEGAHVPMPLHLLGTDAFPCGCGRTWGCAEVYTTISGLPHLLGKLLPKYPGHALATLAVSPKEKVLSLRGLAQQGDALAVEIFNFQAKAMGLHVANLVMILDPKFVVIGGGLMDPEATTMEFRSRYLRILRETANPFLWASQRKQMVIKPAVLGDLSQAIGAALVALKTGAGML